MTTETTGRDQDQGRPHRRRAAPSAETRSLLARYHTAMRSDLSAILDELEPKQSDAGLGLVKPGPVRLATKERASLWDLAMKLGKELGSEIDPGPTPDAGPAKPRASRRRVDYG